MKLLGRVAVVTGAGSGIGQAAAKLLAAEGARVAVVDQDRATAEATSVAIRTGGGEAIALTCDVGDPGSVTATGDRIRSAFGGIDVLVTAAGFSCGGNVLTTSIEDWDSVYRTNVGGTWLWAREVIPSMRQRGGGAIVTFASQLALAGGRGNSAYIAAKGAILSLTRTMALDFANDRIRINSIAPGAIDTPMLARGFARNEDPHAARETSRKRHAMQRFGTVAEIAEAVLYLVSDAASFTTGTTLTVDGGWLAA